MRHISSFFSFSLVAMFFLVSLTGVTAQKALRGNKTIVEDKRILKMFTSINSKYNCDIVVHSGEQPSVVVEIDENLRNQLTTKVVGHSLVIDQKVWIEPSKAVVVHVYSPMITEIRNDGWTNVLIENVDQKKLKFAVQGGKITASGRVEKLKVNSKQGEFDFSNLTISHAEVTLTGYADMKLCCAETTDFDIAEGAEIIIGNGEDVNLARNPIEKAKYIDFQLVNNSYKRNHFVVRGPRQHKFSYGFPMNPYFTKSERWPVGTKVFKVSILGGETLLVEIKESDENTKVKLFK